METPRLLSSTLPLMFQRFFSEDQRNRQETRQSVQSLHVSTAKSVMCSQASILQKARQ